MSTPRLPEEKSLADEAKFQEETRRLREELDEARRLRDEAQAVAENERRLRGEAEARMLPSTLPEFLDACHVHLSVGFSSRVNRMTGTQGQPENANFKVRPDRIRPWTTYSQEHSEVWDDLLKAKFMSESHFTSTNTLKELGKELKARSVGSELDLGYFERFTVEDRVALVIQQMYSSPSLRHAFNLKGKVTFENHGNTMSAEERSAGPKLDLDSDSDLERDGSSSPQSPIRKRRKKVHTHGKALPVTPPPRPKFFRPLVDQFCPPHKLTPAIIQAGLMEIELSEVVVLSEQDDPLKPQQNSDAYIRPTPIKTRSKGPVTPSSCRPSDEGSTNREFDDGDDDDNSGNSGLDPDSPIAGLPRRNPGVMVVLPRQSTQKGKDTQNKRSMAMQYCTQKCLLGLLNGSPLDRNCPNVASHGNGEKHTLDCHEFRRLVRAQVLRKDRGPFGCESMHIHGTSGALFHLTLFSHGYTLVAKGVPVEMVNRAKYEEYIYRHLHPIQGAYVPVCLGSIDISTRPLWYDGIAEIVHLLFLGYAGRRIKFHAGDGNLKQFVPSASESLQAIHGLGVLHGDAHTSNMFWNAEMERVMVIDFERAKIFDRPVYAKTAALMKKRKRGETSYPAATRTKSSSMALFKQELQRLESNLISS